MLIVAMACALSGCAATSARKAARAMRDHDYERAIPLLTALTLEEPSNAKAWARLGEAHYRTGSMAAARESFEHALESNAAFSTAHLFLGYIAEADADTNRVLFHYQVYLDVKKSGPNVREVAARLETLRRKRAEDFARYQVRHEIDLRPSTYSDSTIGVTYFNSGRLSESLRPLAKGLAEMLVTDLSKIRGLRVVERLKTQKLLEELEISQTAAFDSSTAPRIGKLLGAAYLLGGDASELTHGRLRFDPQLVTTASGDVKLTEEQVGELADFFRMQKQIVIDVAEHLGFALTEADRDSIWVIPTTSIVAFLAYSRGLDFQDRGMYEEAHDEYEKATSLDPDFEEAQQRSEQVASFSEGHDPNNPVETSEFSRRTAGQTEWSQREANLADRLSRQHINTGFPPTDVTTATAGGQTDNPDNPPTPSGTTFNIRGRFDDP